MKNQSLRAILTGENPVAVLRAMDKAGSLQQLEPTLAALRMDIPAGYHHKDNLEHSFKVLQNAIDREETGVDLTLRTAALFHDIGKPATRRFQKNKVVTFTNHEVVGARMVNKILSKHGYSKQEIEDIARLVRLHMRSHTFKSGWSESAVRRLGTDVGDFTQLERLIIIFYSDVTTRFDKKKDTIHTFVKELKDALTAVQAKDARAALRPALNGNEVADLLSIKPGKELGAVMKFLNQDEHVGLSKDEATALVLKNFQ